MLPIIAFQVFYKTVWLTIVAYPLWLNDMLTGSDAEQMTKDFMWIVLPIVAMPWGHFFKGFVRNSEKTSFMKPQSLSTQK